MKLIHFADVHLGMENYSITDPKTGMPSRFLDFARSLDRIVDYSLNKKNKIDLVLFCGDAYKTRDPSPTYTKAFAERIKKLADKMPVILIVGNHDLPNSFGKANTLDIFSALDVPQVYVVKKPKLLKIKIKNGIVQIVALPWLNKADLLGNVPEKSIEETNTLITQKLGQEIKKLSSQIDPKYPSVLTAHYSVTGAIYGSEQSVMIGRDMAIDVKDIKKSAFDYVALGHLHKFQKVLDRPLTIYPGSIERIDFGEEKDKKGFEEITIEKQSKPYRSSASENFSLRSKGITRFASAYSKNNFSISDKFIQVPARKFVTIDINILRNQDPNKKVISEIKKYDIKNAVVKVNIKLDSDQADQLENSKIQKALSSALIVVGINTEITDMLKTENITFYKEDLSWQDLLSTYLNQQKISGARAQKLMRAAEDLVEGIKDIQ